MLGGKFMRIALNPSMSSNRQCKKQNPQFGMQILESPVDFIVDPRNADMGAMYGFPMKFWTGKIVRTQENAAKVNRQVAMFVHDLCKPFLNSMSRMVN